MGFLSRREVISHSLEYSKPPTVLFALFTNPQHGRELFGAKDFEITEGLPEAPGRMVVIATYDTAPFARKLPILALTSEVSTRLEITLDTKPHRAKSHATFGTFRQQSDIVFTPQGKGTLLTYDVTYEVPLAMRPLSDGIRHTFTHNMRSTFEGLARLSGDKKAQARLRRHGPTTG